MALGCLRAPGLCPRQHHHRQQLPESGPPKHLARHQVPPKMQNDGMKATGSYRVPDSACEPRPGPTSRCLSCRLLCYPPQHSAGPPWRQVPNCHLCPHKNVSAKLSSPTVGVHAWHRGDVQCPLRPEVLGVGARRSVPRHDL